MMLNRLKNNPLIENVTIRNADGTLEMMIDKRPARGYMCNLTLVLAMFISESARLPVDTLRYITLLLGGSPFIHDYALRLTNEGGWLCYPYGNNITPVSMSVDIEKQLALARYLQSVVTCHQQTSLDSKV